jgi:hypothetical protein
MPHDVRGGGQVIEVALAVLCAAEQIYDAMLSSGTIMIVKRHLIYDYSLG